MSAPIRFEIADRIATLTLDRPDRLNALIPEMQEGFEEALARSAEPDVKVLFLRGAGRAFCAGGDIGWMAKTLTEGRWDELEGLLNLGVTVAHGLATLPKPVVADNAATPAAPFNRLRRSVLMPKMLLYCSVFIE